MTSRSERHLLWPILLILFCFPGAAPALAHAGESGLVLLLPTGYYLLGGTLAVLASFVLTFLCPAGPVSRFLSRALPLGTMRPPPVVLTSALSFVFLAALVLSGLFGSRDPRANPLPVTIWSVWWGSFVFVQALCGDLWSRLNPVIAPYRLLARLAGEDRAWPYPAWLGYWPAVLGFGAFAWLELVDLSPDDPTWLAKLVIAYLAVTLMGMLIFGEEAWLQRGDPFSAFLRLIAHLSPIDVAPVAGEPQRRQLNLVWPGSRLLSMPPLPISGVLFVLMALSTVSFDGLSRTFWWLDLAGINPLEFPGRSAVIGFNSVGLYAVWLMLAALYLGAIRIGCWIDPGWSFRRAAGTLVISIIPIALAYHFAHYLTLVLMEAQYVVQIYGDPLDKGWNPLDLPRNFVTASFLNNFNSVRLIWNAEAGAIVAGHIAAVAVAHVLAARLADGWRAALAPIPLAVLMVFYTLFGLWLLAAPNIG